MRAQPEGDPGRRLTRHQASFVVKGRIFHLGLPLIQFAASVWQ
jgi:hypothetical protein